jgi:hypothetical protein
MITVNFSNGVHAVAILIGAIDTPLEQQQRELAKEEFAHHAARRKRGER